jgi:hypothetical protein
MKRKRLPTDLQVLNAIFDEYYEAFVSCGTGVLRNNYVGRRTIPRFTRPMVPSDIRGATPPVSER